MKRSYQRLGGASVADGGPPGTPTQSQRRLFTGGILVAVGIVALLLLATVPSNTALGPEGSDRLNAVRQLSTQGWAFFTKDPREPFVAVYEHGGDGWQEVTGTSNGEPRFLFGADRRVRTEAYEVEHLTRESADIDWRECQEDGVEGCLDGGEQDAATVISQFEASRFCGEIALVHQEPVPWAWGHMVDEMPAEFKYVDVDCQKLERGGTL